MTVAMPGPGGKSVCIVGRVIERTPVVGTSTFAGFVALGAGVCGSGLADSHDIFARKMTAAVVMRVCFIRFLYSAFGCRAGTARRSQFAAGIAALHHRHIQRFNIIAGISASVPIRLGALRDAGVAGCADFQGVFPRRGFPWMTPAAE